MDNKQYTKLSALVGKNFTVLKAGGYTWKKWDNEARKMLVSDRFEQGFRKIYSVETDKGFLDVGPGQMSTLLEATYKNGKADINNVTFNVKSNGKTGMDIRYYFNVVVQTNDNQDIGEEITMEDFPF